MNLPNGHLLQNGKYKLSQVVGQGGFGITYQGVWLTELKGALGTLQTEVPICVKEYFFKDYCYRDKNNLSIQVHSDTGRLLFNKFKEKLIKEAKILSDVHHPYIVNVLEVFEENNTAYIVMEYISGNSLKWKMDNEGLLPENVVLRYVHQIGEALQFVHEKNILHLDIKPSNILIDKHDKARLIDFGVSKRYDMEEQETSTTLLTLSKGFASIEQYDNEGTQLFSPCPDVYSLGATMYNLLTAKIPIESILRATRPLLPPSDINPDITAQTEGVVLKAMQVIPAERYQTVAEMLANLAKPIAETPASEPLPSEANSPLGNDEATMLLRPTTPRPAEGEEEERTILNTSAGKSPLQEQRKRKKGLLAALFIMLFALTGSAVIWHMYRDRFPQIGQAVVALPMVDEAVSPDTSHIALSEPPKEIALTTPKVEATATQPKPEEVAMPDKQEVKSTLPEQVPPSSVVADPVEVSPQAPGAAELEATYTTQMAAGKAKMGAADYVGAKRAFTQAKEAKLTEEVVRLLILCDTKQEERELADRKAQYEEKMTFGNYKIVRNKKTGRYGAIDHNAVERIPCKYLSVGKSEAGRAFERADNLFDIYNSDGQLLSEGLTYY